MFARVIFLCLVVFLTLDAKDARGELSNLVNKIFRQKAHHSELVSLVSHNKTLSQVMAKDSILIAYNLNNEKYYKDLKNSVRKFDYALDVLKHGDATKNIDKAEDPEVLKDLAEVDAIWEKFHENIERLYDPKSKTINKKALKFIIYKNELLLRLSHKLTQTIKSKNTLNVYTDKVKEHILKIADRQRMLTQKMIKEKLLIFSRLAVKRNRIKLRGSYILFENGLHGLIRGDKKRGIVAITNKKILKKLKLLQSLWDEVSFLYKRPVNKKEMFKLIATEAKINHISNNIYNDIEKATELY